MSEALIGLDIGGGSCRCTLLDVASGDATTASRGLSLRPVPGSGGIGFDLDLDAIWSAVGEATREALERTQTRPSHVVGVATTAMRLGTVLLAERDEVLFAVPNRDSRAVGAGLQLAAQHGEELAARTGRWPSPIFPAARLRLLAEQQPELLARAGCLLSISDWLTWRLCGERVAEPSQAGESLLFDLAAGDWMWDWIERLELPRRIFPSLRQVGQLAGALGDEAATALGLAAGTPVCVGGADTQCGLLGSGATRSGDVALVAGTTGPVQRVVDRPLVDPEHRLWTGHHLVPGRWVVESNAGAMGEAVSWFARVLFPDDPRREARLFGEAASSQPGAAGLLSSFGAEVFDARALAVPVGDLTLNHLSSAQDEAPRRHLARALTEGLACSIRANCEQIAALAGAASTPLRIAGGLSRSETFVRITAETLGSACLQSPVGETSGLGAALCAGVGTGVYASLEDAGDTARVRSVEIDAEAAREADAAYQRWSQLQEAQTASRQLSSVFATPYVLTSSAQPAASDAATLRPKVLVCADFDDASLARLRQIADVDYAPFREKLRLLSGDALVAELEGVDVFVTEIDLVDAAALARLPDLRVVAACRGDAVNVDVAACSAYGIPVVHAPGRNADAVADLAVAFLLMLARKLAAATAFLRSGDIAAGDMGKMGQAFSTLRGRELWGKTVGLVGLGAVGRQVTRRLQGFGATLLVADPFVGVEQAAMAGAELVSLDELLARSDFVSLHAAVTEATRAMIDRDAIAQMKPGACLINTARAALSDEDAIADALASGQLGGAAFDTFSVEPPGSDHPLLAFDNVIATPHVGGNTEDVAAHQGELIVAELERMLAGEPPLHALDPRVLARFDFRATRAAPDAAALAELGRSAGPAVTDLQKQSEPRPARKPAPASAGTATEADDTGAAGDATVAGDRGQVGEQMRRVLAAFVECAIADEGLRSFAQGRDVTLHFDLVDLDCEFYLRVCESGLAGEMRAPAQRAEVELRMQAQVLDGMFSGRGDPMKDAMEGRLSFTGDAAKAMALQEMQSDLQRIYEAAIAKVGEPGDLASLATAEQPGSDASSTSDDVRAQLVAVVGELYAAQLITATGGNVSVRSDSDDQIWITPSQLFKGDLSPDVLVRIGMDGRALGSGTRSPSSEWSMHCAVYQARPDVGAVIHAHAPNATILANAALPFLPISTEAAFFGDIPRIPFVMPGTGDLARAIAEALGDGWAVLMQNHGLLVAGRSLRRAADMAEIIERSCEVILGCHAVGREPPTLPDEIVAELRRMGDLVA